MSVCSCSLMHHICTLLQDVSPSVCAEVDAELEPNKPIMSDWDYLKCLRCFFGGFISAQLRTDLHT